MSNGSVSKTFTVRKKVGTVGVERVFPVNSPLVESVTVIKKGKVRRANLTFLKGMKKDYKTKERNSSVSRNRKREKREIDGFMKKEQSLKVSSPKVKILPKMNSIS